MGNSFFVVIGWIEVAGGDSDFFEDREVFVYATDEVFVERFVELAAEGVAVAEGCASLECMDFLSVEVVVVGEVEFFAGRGADVGVIVGDVVVFAPPGFECLVAVAVDEELVAFFVFDESTAAMEGSGLAELWLDYDSAVGVDVSPEGVVVDFCGVGAESFAEGRSGSIFVFEVFGGRGEVGKCYLEVGGDVFVVDLIVFEYADDCEAVDEFGRVGPFGGTGRGRAVGPKKIVWALLGSAGFFDYHAPAGHFRRGGGAGEVPAGVGEFAASGVVELESVGEVSAPDSFGDGGNADGFVGIGFGVDVDCGAVDVEGFFFGGVFLGEGRG